MLTRPTFPMALHDAGYRTMLAGKYMNSWPCDPRAEFDRWACVATPEISSLSLVDPMREHRRRLADEDRIRAGRAWQRLASDFIEDTPADQPFFVMYTPTTPHLPADDPRYADMPVTPPRGPAFDVEHHDDRDAAVRAAAAAHAGGDRDLRRALHVHGARDALVRRRGRRAARRRSATARRTRSSSISPTTASSTASTAGPARTTRGKSPSRCRWSSGIRRRCRRPARSRATRSCRTWTWRRRSLDAVGIPWGGDGQSFLPVIERKKRTVRTAALIEQCRGVSRGIPDCSGYQLQRRADDDAGVRGRRSRSATSTSSSTTARASSST